MDSLSGAARASGCRRRHPPPRQEYRLLPAAAKSLTYALSSLFFCFQAQQQYTMRRHAGFQLFAGVAGLATPDVVPAVRRLLEVHFSLAQFIADQVCFPVVAEAHR